MTVSPSPFDKAKASTRDDFAREELESLPHWTRTREGLVWQESPMSVRKSPRVDEPSADDAAPSLDKLAYTIPEAGYLLGLCRASVYNLIWRGEIATVNLSRRAPRILREELLAFLQRKAATSQPASRRHTQR